MNRAKRDTNITMRAIAVIPARLASTRLPRKMLREIGGKPLFAYAYLAAKASPMLADVILATDSAEIFNACERLGFHARMTNDMHRSGTERVHEVSNDVAGDVYLNVQGDEPMACRDQIDTLLMLMQNPLVQVGTLKTPCDLHDITNPNAVKVVCDDAGQALYFSRAAVPHDRDASHPAYFKHLGFYAYRKAALDRFVTLPESSLERAERLEQLRFLQAGIPIHVAETPHDSVGVDTEEDIQRVEAMMANRP